MTIIHKTVPDTFCSSAFGKLEIDPGRHFAAIRRDIRGFIADSEAGRDVEAPVEELLS